MTTHRSHSEIPPGYSQLGFSVSNTVQWLEHTSALAHIHKAFWPGKGQAEEKRSLFECISVSLVECCRRVEAELCFAAVRANACRWVRRFDCISGQRLQDASAPHCNDSGTITLVQHVHHDDSECVLSRVMIDFSASCDPSRKQTLQTLHPGSILKP